MLLKFSGHGACLNPYSNGMEIECAEIDKILNRIGLNPYSNGMEIE